MNAVVSLYIKTHSHCVEKKEIETVVALRVACKPLVGAHGRTAIAAAHHRISFPTP